MKRRYDLYVTVATENERLAKKDVRRWLEEIIELGLKHHAGHWPGRTIAIDLEIDMVETE